LTKKKKKKNAWEIGGRTLEGSLHPEKGKQRGDFECRKGVEGIV